MLDNKTMTRLQVAVQEWDISGGALPLVHKQRWRHAAIILQTNCPSEDWPTVQPIAQLLANIGLLEKELKSVLQKTE